MKNKKVFKHLPLILAGFTMSAGVFVNVNSLRKNNAEETQAYYSPSTYYSVSDTASELSSYYSSISDSDSGTSLLSKLQSLNNTKRQRTVGYSTMGTDTGGAFIYTDYDLNNVATDSHGQKYGTKVASFYTKTSATSWNREHVWPNSHGGNYVEADILHTRPTISSENSSRGNSFYVEGVNSSSEGWDPHTAGYDAECRGECARIILYSVVASTSLNLSAVDKISSGQTGYSNTMGNMNTLIKWHFDYSPNIYEINRNNGAEYLQGNRNPFVDHPEYVARIWSNFNTTVSNLCTQNASMYSNWTPGSYSNYGENNAVDSTGVTISKTSETIAVDGTTTISATSSDSSTITWTTSNSGVASISTSSTSSGGSITVTGVSEGTATITAKATISGTQYTKTCSITVSSSSGSGEQGEDYTLIKNTSSLSNNDKIVIKTQQSTPNGVTGWNNSKDATVSTTESQWKQFIVGNKSSSGFTLYDSTESKYIASPTANEFKYSTSGGTCSPNSDGVLTCNSRYLCVNGSNYRFYTDIGSYLPFYIYKVNTSSSSSTLTSISVSTSPTKTSYTVGQYFDPTGLVIQRNYSDSTHDTYTYSGHTSDFSFNPSLSTALTVYHTSVAITYGGKTCSQAITVNQPAITSITATASKTFYVGETITASDITVKDNNNNTVSSFTFANDGYQFTYSDATSGGSLTSKTFTSAITGSGKTCSLTVQVQRKAYVEVTSTSWTKVTSTSSLSVGDVIIIADSTQNVALSTQQNSNNRGVATITKSNNKITWSSGEYEPQQLTLRSTSNIQNAPSGSFGLDTGSGYLYTASSSSNYLRTQETNNINGAFVVTISSGIATISATGSSNRPLMRSNYTASPKIFSCYAANTTIGNTLEIYKKSGVSENPTNIANYIMHEDTTNQCLTKLSNAIDYLGNLTSSDRTTFANSNDYVISTARERLNAWALSQGKTIDYTNATMSNRSGISLMNNNNENNAISIVILISIVGVSSIGIYLYIRKRKISN